MRRIGFNTENKDTHNDKLQGIVLSNIKDDLAKVIFEYCDDRVYPLINGEDRDKWFLKQIQKIRVKYLEDI